MAQRFQYRESKGPREQPVNAEGSRSRKHAHRSSADESDAICDESAATEIARHAALRKSFRFFKLFQFASVRRIAATSEDAIPKHIALRKGGVALQSSRREFVEVEPNQGDRAESVDAFDSIDLRIERALARHGKSARSLFRGKSEQRTPLSIERRWVEDCDACGRVGRIVSRAEREHWKNRIHAHRLDACWGNGWKQRLQRVSTRTTEVPRITIRIQRDDEMPSAFNPIDECFRLISAQSRWCSRRVTPNECIECSESVPAVG